MNIAKENDLYVVEDCAHAIESTLMVNHVEPLRHRMLFFYATKNIVLEKAEWQSQIIKILYQICLV